MTGQQKSKKRKAHRRHISSRRARGWRGSLKRILGIKAKPKRNSKRRRTQK